MNIIYRKAIEKDSREWNEIVNRVWRDAYKDIFPEEVFIDKENRIEEKEKRFIEKLVNNKNMILYVAECENKIVGIMIGEINSGYEYFHNEYADLVGLYIDPKYQGMKIGTNLKNIFEKLAKENGATKYMIGVLKDNINARKVYESWGGTLSKYESDFVKLGVNYKEVFYIFDL